MPILLVLAVLLEFAMLFEPVVLLEVTEFLKFNEGRRRLLGNRCMGESCRGSNFPQAATQNGNSAGESHA